jgi:ABC-type multidrug transport system ATPase subunit
MRRRLSLACALVHKPALLFLDEPTVGIDPALRVEFWNYFRKLAADGTTILVSSHVMDEADRCDELLLILHGKLLARGSGAEIRAQAGVEDDGGRIPQAGRPGDEGMSLRRTLAISRRIAQQFRRDERTLALLFVARS